MNGRDRSCLSGLLLLFCGGMLLAEETAVPLYTNADLERLEPLTLERQPLPEVDAESWEFVTEFLERSHARIDAERDRDIARSVLSTPQVERRRVGYYSSGYSDYPTRKHRPGVYSTHPVRSSRPAAIRPLHAGPSHTMRMRQKAIRNSGRDAVPRRGR